MNPDRKITVIEPIKKQISDASDSTIPKLKVAAYARVSTEMDEQQSSYEAQVDFYTQYIKNNPEWIFVGVFADRGITGTSTKNREQFNSMINLALGGHIDLILTKSISRFARNTVDTLQTVRTLKKAGVEVIFEKENLRTFDPKCEMMLTIMSSLAQEESRSISENVRWGNQKSMQDGKVRFPYSCFLGYKKGKDGAPEIVEEEAKVVRAIYQMFLDGWTIRHIARNLTKKKIPTPRGKSVWSAATVQNILKNEKYKGDALLQKTYVEDFLTKKVRKNNGEMRQYYVAQSHEPIIDPEVFDQVQELLEKQKTYRSKVRDCHPFCNMLICGDCGRFYGHKVWHNHDNTERYDVWYCNAKYQGSKVCSTPTLRELEIYQGLGVVLTQLGEGETTLSATKFREIIESVTINSDRTLKFLLKDGQEITVTL